MLVMLCFVGFCHGQSAWDGTTKTEVKPNGLKYVITTPAQLAWIADACANNEAAREFEGKDVIIDADLDLGNKEWTPIGTPEHPFKGHFIGNNHKIKNLKITGSDKDYVGLFGYIEGQSVNRVKIDSIYVNNSNITGGNQVGVLCGGALNAEFVHIGVKTATINGKTRVGGMVGCIKNSAIFMSYAKGLTMTVTEDYGGLMLGYNDTTFINTLKVSNCYAKGQLTCANHGGGFVGYNGYKGNIEHSYCVIKFAGKVADCLNLGLFCSVNADKAKLNNCVFNNNMNGNMSKVEVASNLNQNSEDVDVWGENLTNMAGLNFFTNFTNDQSARGKWKQDFSQTSGTGFAINEGTPILIWEYHANVSVKEAKEVQDVTIYPNPVQNNLFVRTNGAEIQRIEVMDLLGKTTTVQNNAETLDMSSFKAGIYLIRITTDKGISTQKIVKQ
ncbi:MAG: T9SS type A sorting domain-containing protein [Bacteroidales bacterium]|nr:T9SS type A sorting domain-containing protein [Bacteroidales bacterium]